MHGRSFVGEKASNICFEVIVDGVANILECNFVGDASWRYYQQGILKKTTLLSDVLGVERDLTSSSIISIRTQSSDPKAGLVSFQHKVDSTSVTERDRLWQFLYGVHDDDFDLACTEYGYPELKPIKSGTCKRKGGLLGTKMWLVLTTGRLSLYKKQADTVPSHVMLLTEVQCEDQSDAGISLGIRSGPQDVVFSSRLERDEWKQALQVEIHETTYRSVTLINLKLRNERARPQKIADEIKTPISVKVEESSEISKQKSINTSSARAPAIKTSASSPTAKPPEARSPSSTTNTDVSPRQQLSYLIGPSVFFEVVCAFGKNKMSSMMVEVCFGATELRYSKKEEVVTAVLFKNVKSIIRESTTQDLLSIVYEQENKSMTIKHQIDTSFKDRDSIWQFLYGAVISRSKEVVSREFGFPHMSLIVDGVIKMKCGLSKEFRHGYLHLGRLVLCKKDGNKGAVQEIPSNVVLLTGAEVKAIGKDALVVKSKNKSFELYFESSATRDHWVESLVDVIAECNERVVDLIDVPEAWGEKVLTLDGSRDDSASRIASRDSSISKSTSRDSSISRAASSSTSASSPHPSVTTAVVKAAPAAVVATVTKSGDDSEPEPDEEPPRPCEKWKCSAPAFGSEFCATHSILCHNLRCFEPPSSNSKFCSHHSSQNDGFAEVERQSGVQQEVSKDTKSSELPTYVPPPAGPPPTRKASMKKILNTDPSPPPGEPPKRRGSSNHLLTSTNSGLVLENEISTPKDVLDPPQFVAPPPGPPPKRKASVKKPSNVSSEDPPPPPPGQPIRRKNSSKTAATTNITEPSISDSLVTKLTLNEQFSHGQNEVIAFLEKLNLGFYASSFFEQGFDSIDALHVLEKEDLMEMNVKKGHAKQILADLGVLTVSNSEV